jgi:hypothetical protein
MQFLLSFGWGILFGFFLFNVFLLHHFMKPVEFFLIIIPERL